MQNWNGRNPAFTAPKRCSMSQSHHYCLLPSEKGEIARDSRTNWTLEPGRVLYGLTHSWGKYQCNDRCSGDQGMTIVSRHKIQLLLQVRGQDGELTEQTAAAHKTQIKFTSRDFYKQTESALDKAVREHTASVSCNNNPCGCCHFSKWFPARSAYLNLKEMKQIRFIPQSQLGISLHVIHFLRIGCGPVFAAR